MTRRPYQIKSASPFSSISWICTKGQRKRSSGPSTPCIGRSAAAKYWAAPGPTPLGTACSVGSPFGLASCSHSINGASQQPPSGLRRACAFRHTPPTAVDRAGYLDPKMAKIPFRRRRPRISGTMWCASSPIGKPRPASRIIGLDLGQPPGPAGRIHRPVQHRRRH